MTEVGAAGLGRDGTEGGDHAHSQTRSLPADPVYELETSLTWPTSWEFVRWEACGGADAYLYSVPSLGTGDLAAYWPDCPLVEHVLLVGRLVMNVTGYGVLQPSMYGVLTVNCPPPQTTELYAVGVLAEAGVVCDYTRQSCRPNSTCIPDLNQTEVTFSAGPGGLLSADIPFVAGGAPSGHCEYVLATEAAWLSGSYEEVSYRQFVLHLAADPLGLAPGIYTAHAMLTPMWPHRRCVEVTLVVPETAAVPDQPGPSDAARVSRSRVKAVFR